MSKSKSTDKSVTDSPLDFKLEIKIKDHKRLINLVNELISEGNVNFSWTNLNDDKYTLTIEGSFAINLKEIVKLIPKERGWD
jgi:hypothetical protein